MNFWLQALTFVWWLCFVVYFALYLVHYGCILVKFLTYLWLFSFYHLEYFYCHVQSGQAYQSTIIGRDIKITKQMHMQQWFNNSTTYVKVPTDIDFFSLIHDNWINPLLLSTSFGRKCHFRLHKNNQYFYYVLWLIASYGDTSPIYYF